MFSKRTQTYTVEEIRIGQQWFPFWQVELVMKCLKGTTLGSPYEAQNSDRFEIAQALARENICNEHVYATFVANPSNFDAAYKAICEKPKKPEPFTEEELEEISEEVDRLVGLYLAEEGLEPWDDSDHAMFLRQDYRVQVEQEFREKKENK